jgi:hypothetical protein
MRNPGSRYGDVASLTFATRDRGTVVYLARRFCPAGSALPLLTTRQVRDGDRLDTLTAAVFGDATQYWQIADANDAMNPRELLRPVARWLRIPVPEI